MIPYDPSAYQLFHDGAIALAQVEANGLRIDEEYLSRAIKKTGRRIKRLKKRLDSYEVMKAWRKRFKTKTNLNSGPQLATILFDVMDYEYTGALTKTGKHKTDEDTLALVNDPFVADFLEIKKLDRALTTNLYGIQKYVVNGFVHPSFNLNLVTTFRSSSDSPNFQNIPVRNPKIKKLVRRAVCARHGFHLVEVDYGGVEVRVAACYHKDPTMIRYINDPTKDMHRDMAMECFMLPAKEITKGIRHLGKNQFVFPQFYGDWWQSCAGNLWNSAAKEKTVSGVPLLDHLKSKGIRSLGLQDRRGKTKKGTFEHHIKKVERNFWGKRFAIYAEWKKEWYAEYVDQGWFKTLTGFICKGYMSRNDVINYGVQGDAFHCLLQALIWLQQEITKRGMKTVLTGQIHDSIMADVPPEELELFLRLCQRIMVKRLMRRWPWLIVPLIIEAEVTPVGGSWVDKQVIPIPS